MANGGLHNSELPIPSKTAPSESALDFLGAPPVTPGESLDGYNELRAALTGWAKPKDVIDEILLKDAADLQWEIQRGRSVTADLIGTDKRLSIENVLRLILGNTFFNEGKIDELAEGYTKNDKKIRAEVDEILQEAGLTARSFESQAFANNLAPIFRIGEMDSDKQERRDKIFSYLALRPVDLGSRRHTSHKLGDVEQALIEHSSANDDQTK
jgi:hypothetical protein